MSSETWQRTITDHPAILEAPQTVNPSNLQGWLADQANANGLEWLLAYADDGVIWGKMIDKKLITAYDAAQKFTDLLPFCPPLRAETLQEARLFGERGELLLWRSENGWKMRLIREPEEGQKATWQQAFDETQLLWGTHGDALSEPFTLLQDGAQGLRHAVPVKLKLGPGGITTPPRLVLRHYLNLTGPARVAASRLVKLEHEKGGKDEPKS